MKTKKSILMLALILIVSTFALASCGDDSDPKSSIVGEWRYDYGKSYQILLFEEDGTFLNTHHEYGSAWTEDGRYTVKGDKLTLSYDGEDEVYTILLLTDDTLIIQYNGGNEDPKVFTKVNV